MTLTERKRLAWALIDDAKTILAKMQLLTNCLCITVPVTLRTQDNNHVVHNVLFSFCCKFICCRCSFVLCDAFNVFFCDTWNTPIEFEVVVGHINFWHFSPWYTSSAIPVVCWISQHPFHNKNEFYYVSSIVGNGECGCGAIMQSLCWCWCWCERL